MSKTLSYAHYSQQLWRIYTQFYILSIRTSPHAVFQRLWNNYQGVVEESNKWATKYFTHEKSYCCVPRTSTEFANVNFLRPLLLEDINPETESAMKEFGESYRPLRQRTVREETTKGKPGALPLGVYTKQQDSTKVDLLAD